MMTDDVSGARLEDVGGRQDAELGDAELESVLEALLLVVDTPVTVDTLAAVTEQPGARIEEKLRSMADELTARDSGIDLREAGGGWRMYTRTRYAPYVERLLLDGARSKLQEVRASLESDGADGADGGSEDADGTAQGSSS